MLDFDFTKLALIAAVALIVLGPERLPQVARTLGTLLGRGRRYVDELKSQVTLETELAELRLVKTQVESAVIRSVDTIGSIAPIRRESLVVLPRDDLSSTLSSGNVSAINAVDDIAPGNGSGRKSIYSEQRKHGRPGRAARPSSSHVRKGNPPSTGLQKARSTIVRSEKNCLPVQFL